VFWFSKACVRLALNDGNGNKIQLKLYTVVKGNDVHTLLEDVQSLEEIDNKVRVVNSNILILSKVPSRNEVICHNIKRSAKRKMLIVSRSRDHHITATWRHV